MPALEIEGLIDDISEYIDGSTDKHRLAFTTEGDAQKAYELLLSEEGQSMLVTAYGSGELQPQGEDLILSPFYGPSIYWWLIFIWMR